MRTEFHTDSLTPQKAVGCALFGVVVLVIFGFSALRGRATSEWSSVEGTVSESRVGRSSSASGRIQYYARVAYEYEVNAVRYVGNTIAIGAVTGFLVRESSAQKIVEKYPVGKRVRVYYDPEDPSKAVLEPGASSDVTVMLPIGGFILVVGVVILVVILLGKRGAAARRRRIEERRARRQS